MSPRKSKVHQFGDTLGKGIEVGGDTLGVGVELLGISIRKGIEATRRGVYGLVKYPEAHE